MTGDLLLIHSEPLNGHGVLVDQAVWAVELVAAVVAVSVTIANLVLSNTETPTVTVKRSCVKKIRNASVSSRKIYHEVLLSTLWCLIEDVLY